MSFMDPDQREALAKKAESDREKCRKAGSHQWQGDYCTVCRSAHPDYRKPRVTLAAGDYRAVLNPESGNVTIEKRSRDSVGGERWDFVETLSNTHSKSDPSKHHLIELLTKGRAP